MRNISDEDQSREKGQVGPVAADQLMTELRKSLNSADGKEGWISESDAYRSVGVEE